MKKKFVYFFGDGKAEGNKDMKDLLGGKGAGLAEMTNTGVPVPPGFTITTEACRYYQTHKAYPPGLEEEIEANLSMVEKSMGKGFGDPENPLLLSVRSGAKFSMPGMMDTVLNLGLNDQTLVGLTHKTSNRRMAYDSYRRFIQMFGSIVLGMEHKDFEVVLKEIKRVKGVRLDTELDADDLAHLVERYKEEVKEVKGIEIPQDPREQLKMTIIAVFDSWDNPRAITYRKLNNIPDDLGTAVTIQAMVFGNMGQNSGTGVAFTRDPALGKKKFYGEYLLNAQGEDVVAGIRTPNPISRLKEELPEAYGQLMDIYQKLEAHYRDMQDIEFTIEDGRLFMLQTRTGKRTTKAAIKIAVDMTNEGLISKEEALLRIEANQLDQLLHRQIDPSAKKEVIACGLAASPGAASGKVVFTPDDACEWNHEGHRVILVRTETSPDDIHGMAVAQGILTSRGGMTSHAAVVARGMGKCCVAGCEAISVNEEAKEFRVKDLVVKEGDVITIDGGTGEVILEEVPTIEPELTPEMLTFLSWADEIRSLGVRANADTPEDAKRARDFGAEGIGLCRTEHMFFGEERLPIMQAMILAKDEETRRSTLDKLLPMQKQDFKDILKAMEGLPVTIRLLDPPLHEFLPKTEEEVERLSRKIGVPKKEIARKTEDLKEFNPMLGNRGCRLGIIMPEIYQMQVRAIFEAACELVKEGYHVKPEVMIPLVGHVNELKVLKEDTQRIAQEIVNSIGVNLDYFIGTMIELPRACITADEIATEAEFFSFGTNDLTQTVFGFSRDDAEGKFLFQYVDKKILEDNPFAVLDREGVGELVRMAVEKGRKVRPHLKIGICGEHGGDPSSIEFCHQVGLDYVSCSPYRVPIARLAAAHAKLKKSAREDLSDTR
ncbi:TPA: pyruvate, phosphate dikinase [bacterium]|nr:pyruvate, phosphate dikinase [bacterium]